MCAHPPVKVQSLTFVLGKVYIYMVLKVQFLPEGSPTAWWNPWKSLLQMTRSWSTAINCTRRQPMLHDILFSFVMGNTSTRRSLILIENWHHLVCFVESNWVNMHVKYFRFLVKRLWQWHKPLASLAITSMFLEPVKWTKFFSKGKVCPVNRPVKC